MRDCGAMTELCVGLLAAATVGVPDRYEQLRRHRGFGLDDRRDEEDRGDGRRKRQKLSS